jgi:hypothetical protein
MSKAWSRKVSFRVLYCGQTTALANYGTNWSLGKGAENWLKIRALWKSNHGSKDSREHEGAPDEAEASSRRSFHPHHDTMLAGCCSTATER